MPSAERADERDGSHRGQRALIVLTAALRRMLLVQQGGACASSKAPWSVN